MITSGLCHNIFLSNRLMNSYLSCDLIKDAQKVFSQILNKNLVSWTILISGLTKIDGFFEAIGLFREMMKSGLLPNAVTIASVVPAFAKLALTSMGKSVHGFWVRRNFESNVFVGTALLDMYSRFGCIAVARKVFDKMPDKNVVSWNTIILGYADNGFGEEALWLSNLMRKRGVLVDYFTVMSMLSACLSVEHLQVGMGIHGFTTRNGLDNDRLIKTALIDVYVRGNWIDDAYCIFNEMPVKDVVAWTLMLTGFSSGQYWNKAMEHFNKMIGVEELELDSVALMGILSSCSSSGALWHGRRIHALVVKAGFEGDIFVGSAVVVMYASCASLEGAIRFFNGMKDKDVACWNAMIDGYAINGYGNDAIDLFLKMKGCGVNPDESTLLSVLCACSHAGMVAEGLQIFNHMAHNRKIIPTLKHYACVVDLLGRAGQLDDACSLIDNMPRQPDFEVYGALLSACRVYNNCELGKKVSQKLFKLNPDDGGYFVLHSNMHALAGNWGDAEASRILLKLKGLKKDPGFSSIEIYGEIYRYLSG
ncbi:hypothetical protein RJ639_018347 [Escallonia herrerae]|uniref:Chlororespiratory reduction 21 n=1 Tax=Escallonia herrerae TaxID=1293975 RepID=A0AA89AGG9_9ASTE|nr:hypothetical protein RJ639_018347 [Escallonia herrerae]